MRPRLISLGIAIAITCLVFPEVVFLGGSLSPVGLNDTLTHGRSPRTVQVYPNLHGRGPRVGVRDIDARVFQFVPATKFMHRAISNGESPFWNPYSAAGSYGPETLADLKLSPFVLTVAVLGASATAFTFVILLFVVLSLYCLQQLMTFTLRLGRPAAMAACVVWLLSGFGESDINSTPGAPYLLFPVLLYALVAYRRRGGAVRLVAAVAAYVAFLLTTFVPTQLLILVVVHSVLLVLDAPSWPSGQHLLVRVGTIARRHLVVPVVALFVSAYVWLPDLVVLGRGASGFAKYGQRSLGLTGPLSYLRRIVSPLAVSGGHWLTFVGIVPVLVIAGAWPRARGLQRRLLNLTGALALLALGLHAGFPVVRLIGDLPGLRAVRQEYWAALAGTAETLAIGVAIAVLAKRGVSRLAVGIVGTFLVFWLFGTAVGEFARGHAGLTLTAFMAAVLIIVTVIITSASATVRSRRRPIAIAAVCMIALELFTYQNHARIERYEAESPPPRYLTFLRRNLGPGRILDAGRGGIYPDWGSALGIPQVETFNVSQIPAYRDFFHHYLVPSRGLFLEIGSIRTRPYRIKPTVLDLLSVRYIVSDGTMPRFEAGVRARYPLVFTDRTAHIQIFLNRNAFPRAFLSPALTAPSSAKTKTFSKQLTQSPDRALLATARAAGIPSTRQSTALPGNARVTKYHNTEVRVEVDASKPSVLVLTDNYAYGWHVSVNGNSQHLGRVDEIMRGVVVPAGHSTVVFSYRAAPRSIGEVISLLTIGLLLGYMLLSGTRSRRRARVPVGAPELTGVGC